MSRKVLMLSERVEAIKLHDGGKFSRCCTDNGHWKNANPTDY